MRRWEHHRTRSKIALLVLINLVTLLGGKYTALITMVKLELFGEAVAAAKTPQKKPATSPPSRAAQGAPPLALAATGPSTPLSQAETRLHVVRRGETLSQIARVYGVSVRTLQLANHLKDPDHLQRGQRLRIPTDDRAALRASKTQGQKERQSSPPTKRRQSFSWPVEGVLTSPFGKRGRVMGGGGRRFHAGIDLAVPVGTRVRAAQPGIVVFAGYNGAYGKVVKLDHQHGYSTLYAHNSRLLVHVGQRVKAGHVICLSGNTGRSTGPHLHFEVHKDGWPVNPLPYLQ